MSKNNGSINNAIDNAIDDAVTYTRFSINLWGVLLLITGYCFYAQPVGSSMVWVTVLGVAWTIGSFMDIVFLVSERGRYWGWRLLGAIIGLVAGIYILSEPLLSTEFIVLYAYVLLGVSALMRGGFNIYLGVEAPEGNRWPGLVVGILQILAGCWLLYSFSIGVIVFVPVMGVLMMIGGIAAIISSFL